MYVRIHVPTDKARNWVTSLYVIDSTVDKFKTMAHNLKSR